MYPLRGSIDHGTFAFAALIRPLANVGGSQRCPNCLARHRELHHHQLGRPDLRDIHPEPGWLRRMSRSDERPAGESKYRVLRYYVSRKVFFFPRARVNVSVLTCIDPHSQIWWCRVRGRYLGDLPNPIVVGCVFPRGCVCYATALNIVISMEYFSSP